MTRRLTRIMLAAVVVSVALLPTSRVQAISSRSFFSTAPVPALYGYRAARLVDGIHPDSSIEDGAWLRLLPQFSRLADLRGGSAREGVAVLDVSVPLGSAPNFIVVYSSGGSPIWSDVLPPSTQDLRVKNGRILASSTAQPDSGDPSCCGTVDSVTTYRWDSGRGTFVRRTTIYDDEWVVKTLLRNVRKGRYTAARRTASAALVSRLRREVERGAQLTLIDCIGQLDSTIDGDRQCSVSTSDGDTINLIFIDLDRIGFQQWRAS